MERMHQTLSQPPQCLLVSTYILSYLFSLFYSNPLTHTAPSAAPTNADVSVINSTALNVQWGPVPCIEQNGDITGYTVRVLESGEMERVEDVGDVNNVTISELTPSTTYSIQVAAVNSEGSGPYSDLIIIDTPDSELYVDILHLSWLAM